jgi:hypothetical protein
MQFMPKPDWVPSQPPDDMYDKIEFAITCNEEISDIDLHLSILATNGNVMQVLDSA